MPPATSTDALQLELRGKLLLARPERARTVETGLKYRGQAFSATFSAYYTQLADLIGRVKTTDSLQGYPVYLKENIGKSFIAGAEAAAEWRLQKNWTALGNVTYTYGQNTSAKEPFRRIPPAHGLIAPRWQVLSCWRAPPP